MSDLEFDLESLICECHLVSWAELKRELKEHNCSSFEFEDLKKLKIIGHGCGQCLKIWELELRKLIDSQKY